MTQPLPQEAASTAAPLSTRGLIAMGVVLIVLGAVSGCFALLTPLAPLMAKWSQQQMPPMDAKSMAAAALTQGAFAAVLITLGIASCRALRWVVPVMLSIAWIWLITGTINFGLALWVTPRMMEQLRAQLPDTAGSESMLVLMIAIGHAISFILQVAIPGALIFFYKRPAVLAACRQRHPEPSWTDRCPTTVVAISIALALLALMLLFGLFYNVVPFFGVILTGVPAAVSLLAGGAVCALLSWSTARLKMAAWWGTVVLFIFITIGPVITFIRHDIFDIYAAGGMPPQQIEQMRTMIGDTQLYNTTTIVTAVLLGIISIVYMLRIRRHFLPAESDDRVA